MPPLRAAVRGWLALVQCPQAVNDAAHPQPLAAVAAVARPHATGATHLNGPPTAAVLPRPSILSAALAQRRAAAAAASASVTETPGFLRA